MELQCKRAVRGWKEGKAAQEEFQNTALTCRDGVRKTHLVLRLERRTSLERVTQLLSPPLAFGAYS